MEIRTATEQETERVKLGHGVKGKSRGPIRLRVAAIEDEVAVFDGCCDGAQGSKCATQGQVRGAMTNAQLTFPGKKYTHTHRDGAVYVWKVKG